MSEKATEEKEALQLKDVQSKAMNRMQCSLMGRLLPAATTRSESPWSLVRFNPFPQHRQGSWGLGQELEHIDMSQCDENIAGALL